MKFSQMLHVDTFVCYMLFSQRLFIFTSNTFLYGVVKK
uniref:Uncharacterized protein n=1 Tax=Anopheles atroparvus TaxID=41427 RepID=A0AAG5DJY7_ANOAO